MEFLLSHWHCIIPAMGIGVAFLLLREKPGVKKENKPDHSALMSRQNNEE